MAFIIPTTATLLAYEKVGVAFKVAPYAPVLGGHGVQVRPTAKVPKDGETTSEGLAPVAGVLVPTKSQKGLQIRRVMPVVIIATCHASRLEGSGLP